MSIYKELTKKHLLYHKRRTVLSIIGIMLSVALITAIGTFLVSFQQNNVQKTAQEFGAYHILVQNGNSDAVRMLQANPQVKRVGLLGHKERVRLLNGKILYLQKATETAIALAPFSVIKQKEGKGQRLIVERWVVPYLGQDVRVGQAVTMTKEDTSKETFTVEKIIKNVPYNWGLDALHAYIPSDHVNETNATILVEMQKQGSVEDVVRQLNRFVKPQDIQFNERLLGALGMERKEGKGIDTESVSIYSIPIVIVITVTIALIYNTFQISVAQRIRYIGLLRAVGATKSHIRRMVMHEASILSIISIPLGLVFGVAGFWLVAKLFQLFREPGEFSVFHIEVVLSPVVLITSALVSLFSVYLSAWLPARFAGRISPLAAIRQSFLLSRKKQKEKGPTFLDRFVGIETVMAYRNLRRNRKRSYITIFSLAISVVLFVTFTSFAQLLFKEEMLSENQNADVVLYNNSTTNDKQVFTPELLKKLRRLDEIKEIYVHYPAEQTAVMFPMINSGGAQKRDDPYVYPVRIDKKTYAGMYMMVSPYAKENRQWLERRLIEGEINENKLQGNGVIVVKGKNAPSIRLGDELFIASSSLQPEDETYDQNQLRKVSVTGIIEGGNSRFSFIVPVSVMKYITDNTNTTQAITRVDIILKNQEDERKMIQRLEKMVVGNPNIKVSNQFEAKREVASIKLQLYILLYGFITVIVLIGGGSGYDTHTMEVAPICYRGNDWNRICCGTHCAPFVGK